MVIAVLSSIRSSFMSAELCKKTHVLQHQNIKTSTIYNHDGQDFVCEVTEKQLETQQIRSWKKAMGTTVYYKTNSHAKGKGKISRH